MSKSKDDAPHELESQFVLRLPPVRDGSAGLLGEHGGGERGQQGRGARWGICRPGKGPGSRLGACGRG